MVLYRKYRPQSLEQLIGQTQVKLALSSALLNNKLAHAYLFVGPRGTGKTSTARILAKMVNCEQQSSVVSRQSSDKKSLKADSEASLKTDSYPCNKCQTCMSITDGSNLDLIEIDAASNRGIEDIRSLRETIKLAPAGAKKKIYIIDEVHMLTTEAFNALLKTLEEPPEHVLFILATTEVAKVPQTILSRVQRLDFKLAKPSELVEALKIVSEGEKIKIDEEALKLLAKMADGSFRDGVKLLDQLAGAGKAVTAQDVKDKLKVSDFQTLTAILQAMAQKNGAEALTLVSKVLDEGVSVKELTTDLMDLLRQMVLIKNGLGEVLVKEEIGSDKYQVLAEIDFSMQDLLKIIDKLQEAWEKLKNASIPSLPLEIAIVEICGEEVNAPSSIVKNPPSTVQHLSSSPDSSEISKIKEKWTFVLETIRPYNFSLEALLRSVKIADCADGVVLLEVPYSFHQRILEAPKSRDLLEAVLSDVLQKSVKVSTVLGERPQKMEDIANIEVAADDDVIKAASEIFNGKLVD